MAETENDHSPGDNIDRQGHLTWLERFIWEHYKGQPRLVRAFVFLMFAILLALSLGRMTTGHFTVLGHVFKRSGDVLAPAGKVDVVVNDKYFGSNHVGAVYLVLTPVQYARVLLERRLRVATLHDRGERLPHTVPFSLLDGFQIELVEQAVPEPVIEEGRVPWSLMPSTAFADEASARERLFVTSITLSGSEGKASSARMTLDGRSLQSVDAPGVAPDLPVVRGATVQFGESYYFPYDRGSDGRIQVTTSGLFGTSERFTVDHAIPVGTEIEIQNDIGSTIKVLRLSPYAVVIWRRKDIADTADKVTAELRSAGFWVAHNPNAPLGSSRPTNSVFSGADVPYTEVQKVLRVLRDNSVPIAGVAYKRHLKSGNQSEIQIGSSNWASALEPLSAETYDHILSADSERLFRQRLRGHDEAARLDDQRPRGELTYSLNAATPTLSTQ